MLVTENSKPFMNTDRIFYLNNLWQKLSYYNIHLPFHLSPKLAGHIAIQNKILHPGHPWAGFIHMTKFLGEGNSKPFQYSCLENNRTEWKVKKIVHWKMNSPGQ